MTVIVGLFNPKSPTNVGAVMRAAGCYQVSEVRYTGERYERAVKFQTDTKNVQGKIPLTGVEELSDAIAAETKIVCVEFAVGAVALPEFQHPEHALYIFGPEDGSLPQSVVDKADSVVYVPTVGCMNLAATVNVLLYDRLAKSSRDYGERDVLENRDNKNRLVVNEKNKVS